MKKSYFNKALLLFELFRKRQINQDDLAKAAGKSVYLEDKVAEFRLLIAMSKDVFAGRYHMDKWNLSIIVATIAYVVSPLDAIPDLAPLVGWMDDMAIVAYAVSKLTDEMKKYQAFIHSSQKINPGLTAG